jgi:enamine deaminase RidA (YjgF/YER057c/UK114 family)
VKVHNPRTIADPAGTYSHGIEVPPNARWLYIAGQVGTRKDGTVPPSIEEQSEIAWQNIVAILAAADMKVTDIVKIQQFVLSLEDFPKYAATRAKFLGSHRPASTALVVKALVRPNWLVEVEAVAAQAARRAPAAASKPAAKKRTAARPKKR